MLIDWFTLGAQALNFLLLVWLMKRFLYRPILQAVDAREKRIAAEIADAAARQAEAQKEREEFQARNEEFDRQRAGLLSQATAEAAAERQRLLDDARRAAAVTAASLEEARCNEARTLHQAIGRRIQEEVFSVARQVLSDLASTSLEERLCDVLARRVRGLDKPARAALAAVLQTAREPALVRSAFELPAAQRAALQQALNETFSADIGLRYVTAPDLVCGIELVAEGQKVAWSIADYLSVLESHVGDLLAAPDAQDARTAEEAAHAVAA